MTTLAENLERPVITVGGPTKASLEALQRRLGYVVLDGPSSQPRRVRVDRMEQHSTWRHLSGTGQGAMYQREEVGHGV